MSATETYTLAHTARCKLQLAADRPDRNLRFILGHAFTLDKLRLRIAEIEMDMEDEEDQNGELSEPLSAPRERRVSFGNNTRPAKPIDRRRSPPPDQFADLPDTDSESDEGDVEVDDEEDDDLSLQRFESGSARQPQMIDDDDGSDEEEELKSPPPMPSEDELRMITGGEDDDELAEAYEHVADCPCHGQKGPPASHVWEIPQKPGQHGQRYAVVAVGA
jgi:hypothetical protein